MRCGRVILEKITAGPAFKGMEKKQQHKPRKDEHMHDPAQGIFLEDSPLQDDIQYQNFHQNHDPAAENYTQNAF